MKVEVDLEGVHIVRSKRGAVYAYAWRGGPSVKARPIDSRAFVEEVLELRKDRNAPDKSKVSGLITLYKASDAWKVDAGPKTKASWSTWLDRITIKFGGYPIGAFDRPKVVPVIRKWRDGYRATPRAADLGIQVLSRLMSFGGEEGLLSTNPCVHIPRLYHSDRSEIIWLAQDLAELELRASPQVFLAARLGALTGLRQGDLLKLRWCHVGEHAIDMATGKSRGRRRALVPMYPELRELLDAIPRRADVPRGQDTTHVLLNSYGKPWKTGFGASWQDAVGGLEATTDRPARPRLAREVDGLGLVDLHFHDLRGTAATKFHLAGFDDDEIAETLAWSKRAVKTIIDRYVRHGALMEARIKRLENVPGT